jgi:purine-nucleoside phosphorylase
VRERDYFVEDARRVAAFLKQRTTQRPEIAVVVGSRLKGFELLIEDDERVTFEELHAHFPTFPTCSVPPGPAGAFVFGSIDGVPVLVMLGRFHLYEGHSSQATSFPIRVMKELGVHTLILTNAARGLSPTLQIGDVMYVRERASEKF